MVNETVGYRVGRAQERCGRKKGEINKNLFDDAIIRASQGNRDVLGEHLTDIDGQAVYFKDRGGTTLGIKPDHIFALDGGGK